MKPCYLISCEHATNHIPVAYQKLFTGCKSILQSHRGWDIGAQDFYTALCRLVPVKSQKASWSRLLIELNRSLHHQDVFSEFTRNLNIDEKQAIIKKYYCPYRDKITNQIEKLLKNNNKVIHLSIHSFTPVLNGVARNADIGFLYDPKRKAERDFCYGLKHHLREKTAHLKIRMNYPYKGDSDGLTTALRHIFPAKKYLGIELELNQLYLTKKSQRQKFITMLAPVLANFLNTQSF